MSELQKMETSLSFQTVNLLDGNLPSLKDAVEIPIDICGEYWTPEYEGESKRLYFVDIAIQKVLSVDGTGALIDLPCARFMEILEDGTAKMITNGSRRLVGILEQSFETGILKSGSLLKVTFRGKRRNKSNNFSSDNWSIIPLRLKI